MEISDLIRPVMELDFIEDSADAESAVRMVLSFLTGRMEGPLAHKLTGQLPELLAYEKLHTCPGPVAIISVVEMVSHVAARFRLSHDQASTLVNHVIRVVRDAAGKDVILEMENDMPSDWSTLLYDA